MDVDQSNLPDEEPTPENLPEVWEERQPEVLETFEDGGFAVMFRRNGRKFEPLDASTYYVPPEAGEHDDTEWWEDWFAVSGRYQYGERQRRAVVLGRLNERTGYWYEDAGSGNAIPLSVALDGRKAIAAYLYAEQRLSTGAIAEKMDRAESTVRQYVTDYKAGRMG